MSFFIQHTDVNASRKDYAHLKNQMLVTKVFYTLQGEGPHAGTPAVFVRLAGCNRGDKASMGCAFCDTNFLLSEGIALGYAEISDLMQTVIHREAQANNPHEFPLVVITGGEPMIQDNLVGFLEHLGRNNWHTIQIESNGDRLARGFAESKWCVTVDLVVSPKASYSGYHRLNPDVLCRANYLKFLIDSEEPPYTSLPNYAMVKNPQDVFLSPITVYNQEVTAGGAVGFSTRIDRERTANNYAHAAKLALQYGYRVSMQQHLFFGVE